MVAYNFQPVFEPQIIDSTKRQTVRALRKRHARSGEAIQLYCEQRSTHCRKIIPDPVCCSVHLIHINTSDLLPEFIASIEIDGIPLRKEEIELFASADGFAPAYFGMFRDDGEPATARSWMGSFWRKRHGVGRFEGVLVKWVPA